MMKYYISDLHFFHRNVNELDDRGFETMFDMHETMIAKWNEKVKEDDEIYILGDFSFGKGVETWDVLNRLSGKLILIEGNHDFHFLDDKEFVDSIFDEIVSYAEINDSKRNVILSHFPMPIYNHQFRMDENDKPRTYMLYGHVHNTYDEYLINRFINDSNLLIRPHSKGKISSTPMNLINTFAMFSDYRPMSLDEWIEIDNKRRNMINEFEEKCGGTIDYDRWLELNELIINKAKNDWK